MKEETLTNKEVEIAKSRIYDVLASLSKSERRDVLLYVLNMLDVPQEILTSEIV
jgi:hypothetical protein